MTKKVVEIIRVTTTTQADFGPDGVAGQMAINCRTCKLHDLEPVHSIELVGASACQMFDTHDGQQVLNLITDPGIEGVVVAEFSVLLRLSTLILLDRFAATNTLIYTAAEVINLNAVTAAFRCLIAHEELSHMQDRMKHGREAKRRAGKYVGGSLSLGVAVSAHGGYSYTEDAVKIQGAAEAFLSGKTSYSMLAKDLGIARSGVRRLLQNPIYTGWLVIDKCRDASSDGYVPGSNGRRGYRKKVARAPEDVIRVKVIEPGLITTEKFDQIQKLIATKASRSKSDRCKTS